MSVYLKNINMILRAFFMEKGLSKAAVARKTGLSESMIGTYVNDKVTPSVKTLAILLDTFIGLEAYIFRDKDKKKTKAVRLAEEQEELLAGLKMENRDQKNLEAQIAGLKRENKTLTEENAELKDLLNANGKLFRQIGSIEKHYFYLKKIRE